LFGITDKKNPSFREFVGEMKGALMSGELLKNSLDLTEKAVKNTIGPVKEATPDTPSLTRMYNITTVVGSGAWDYSRLKLGQVRRNTMNNVNQRMTKATDMVNQRMMKARESMTPAIKMATPYYNMAISYLAPLPIVGRFFTTTPPTEMSATSSSGLMEEGTKGKTTTTKVEVKTTSKMESGLKPYPSGGMGSVSLGGTTVTSGEETTTDSTNSGHEKKKKHHGKA